IYEGRIIGLIDGKINMQSNARGDDPDSTSQSLYSYHKILCNKPLHNGKLFQLSDSQRCAYLYHNSELGEFFLGSDSITHSYKNQKKFKEITEQAPKHVNELYDAGSTIGAFIEIFWCSF